MMGTARRTTSKPNMQRSLSTKGSNSGFSKLYDPIVKTILRSPFHGLMSRNTMLITFTGRRSGKMYTTPVNYVANRDSITVFSQRNRAWRKNLRGGAPVTLRVRGQNLEAIGESFEDEEAVATGLSAYLQKFPRYAKYFKVTLDADGQPDPEEVAKAAQNRVLIRVILTRTRVT